MADPIALAAAAAVPAAVHVAEAPIVVLSPFLVGGVIVNVFGEVLPAERPRDRADRLSAPPHRDLDGAVSKAAAGGHT